MPGTELNGRNSVSACLLCYNDAPTIGGLVDAAGSALDLLGAAGEIVVVDDGSTDESRERLREAREREPRLRVVEHARNRGYGGAVRSALAAARGDWVFYTDGDGQYDPGELVRLAELRGPGIDVVQGYKGTRADGAVRSAVGNTWSVAVRRGFGLGVRDPDCDFRLIRGELISSIELRRDSGAICIELVRALEDAGARFIEVEVSHYPRVAGRSQFFRPGHVARTLTDAAGMWRVRRLRRPRTPQEPRPGTISS